MDQQQWEKVNNIVDTALDLQGNERATYIENQCKGNPNLYQQVTELLTSIEQSEGFLENPEDFPQHLAQDISVEGIDQDSSALVGSTIGNYKLLELIGHGGMGSVFLAERPDQTYTKKVALKLMRRSMGTPSNIARFKREQNILAKLSHPNIARLLDGGMTADGLPYLVMEYVEGTPLYDYCDQNNLSISERLELFKSICRALQHAHGNAIIHRDLKPSNILVTKEGKIKILDFGIAKLLEPDNPDTNLFETQTGQRILTLGYAAPEQVVQKTITTRTDIYSLGILLYELLTGDHPFDMAGKNLTEIEQCIRHQTPQKPSVRFQKLDSNQQQEQASIRDISPEQLISQLKGDIDAIVMKILRKEPEARYDAISQMLEDLDRREKNKPIIARKDTFRYRTTKFFRRYKTVLSTAAGIILVIAGIIFYYSWQITQERNIAQTEAEKAEQVTAFLTDLIESNYPQNAQGDTITVREFLNQGYDRVQKLDESPEVKANVMQVMAHTYRSLGEIDKAAPLMQEVVEIYDTLSINPAEKAEAYNIRGLITRDKGNFEEAEKVMDRAVALFQKAGETNTEEYARLLANLAYIKRLNANYEEAFSLAQDALEIENSMYDKPNAKLAETYYVLASILRKQDKYGEAKTYQLKSLNMLQTVIDGPHPGKANNFNNLAIIYETQDSLNQAANYYKKSLNMSEDLYGSSHPEIANISSNFSDILLKQGKVDSAELMIQKAMRITTNEMDETHPIMGNHLNDYAEIYEHKEKYHIADSLLERSLRILKKNFPDDHPRVVGVLHNKGTNAHRAGNIDQAEQILRKVLTARQKRYAPSDENIQIPLTRLLNILETKQKFSEIDSLKSLFSPESQKD